MRVFPADSPRPTGSHAERKLYAALAKCSQQWLAFHSLRMRSREGWEGEGDFVLVNPAAGMMVLEVKGGQIELREGRWYQNARPLDKAPRDQGLSFAKRLASELKAAGLEVPSYGVASVFPDCEFTNPPVNGDLRGLVLGARDLPYLSEVLDEVFKIAVPVGRVPSNRKWVQQLETWWGQSWVPQVKLTDRAADAAERSIALDSSQYTLLEMAGETPRALVEGPAGSGKTLVATELCRRRASAGQRATYVCFTDALAKAVNVQFQAAECPEPRPRATSIRQLAVDLLRKNGSPIPPPDKAFWDEVSFNAAADALPPEAERPDVVVVDEGQDFEASDWMLVEQLAGARGLWVFRDKRQAFWSERTLPDALETTLTGRLKLLQRYRCPAGLASFAECFASNETPAQRPSPDEVRLVVCPGAETSERVRHLIDQLRKEGAKASDIAIVSLAGQTRSALFGLSKLGSHRLVHGDSPEAKDHVVVETFLRFKGLERPFVIVCEASGAHLTHFGTRAYIGLTRATVQAIIVAEQSVVAADPRLSLLAV